MPEGWACVGYVLPNFSKMKIIPARQDSWEYVVERVGAKAMQD